MPKRSAALLVYRRAEHAMEVLLVHPGGPFWARRDAGSWSVPKGEFPPEENARAAALREFAEELGVPAPDGPAIELGEARQPSRKVVICFAVEGDLDASRVASNLVEIEWPPRSGKSLSVPEVDRAGWFSLEDARIKILPGQAVFLDRLEDATNP